MSVYALVFSDDEVGLAKRLEFRAEDLVSALVIAHSEAARRSAQLWHGAKKLCTIRAGERSPPNFAALPVL